MRVDTGRGGSERTERSGVSQRHNTADVDVE